MSATTGLVWSARYLDHETGPGHPEQPERLAAVEHSLREAGFFQSTRGIAPHADDMTPVLRVHESAYIERFHRACEEGLHCLDSCECPVCPASFEIAMLAAGGAVAAVEAVMEERVRNAFCALRPPGHHAERGLAMGFCYFNNTAIAAEHLRARYGLRRIAILDWDVHHGNGTQHLFEDDPDVFVCDIHQHPHTLYPGTGFDWEKGCGPGVGATLNIPLMPGSGDADYRWAFDNRIVPAIDDFRPEFLLVSAGFDAHRDDPLADIELSTEMFVWMTLQAMNLAETHCEGRLVSLLEGGYDPAVLAECVCVHLGTLAGITTGVGD